MKPKSTKDCTYALRNEGLIEERFLADLPKHRKRPAWIRSEPLVSVGAWEPLFHRRRTGETWVDDEEFYAYEHSERFVRDLKAIGANLLITAFDKNYHIDEWEWPLKQKLAGFCRKHGLRLGTYLRADQIQSEVFAGLLRKKDLLAAQSDGRVPLYGFQEWRKSICFHKPGVLEMFKKNIRRAVVDLGVDALHLDGFEVGGFETRGACRCAACHRDFREFLARRYGGDPEACRRRFGHEHFAGIVPPGLGAFSGLPAVPTGLVTDPVWQEWVIFRCTWTARIVRAISEYVYRLNPEVALLANNIVAVKENAALYCGTDLYSYGDAVDVLINEDPYHPRLTAGGQVIQRARQHKLAAEAGCRLWNYMDTPDADLGVAMAHAAAFNQGRVTSIGFTFSLYGDFRRAKTIKKSFLAWQRDHWEVFQGLTEVADVAVWRDRRALAFAPLISYATAMQVEQLLIEDRLPFAVSQRAWPADARVVVAPQLVCLDDESCAALVRFVRNGGGALIVGETATRDGWGRRRTDFGLRSILPEQVGLPPDVAFRCNQAIADTAFCPEEAPTVADEAFHFCTAGKGRVGYVKSLVDPATQPVMFNPDHTAEWPFDTTNWRIPAKAAQVRRALAWLAGNRFTFRVKSVRGVVANYYRQPTTGAYSVHLVNLTPKPVAGTVIEACLGKSRKPFRVEVISPDEPRHQEAQWSTRGEILRITLPRLKTYAVVVIR